MDHKPLKFGESISYCVGDVANNFVNQLIGAFLLVFYTDYFGISPLAAGTLFLVARIWDAVNDPIVGYLVDKTNTRWGRFKPWIAFAALPCALFTVAAFTIPAEGMSDTAKLVYAYATYIGYGMMYTMVTVPYLSMISVMSEDSEERTKLLGLRQGLAMIAAIGLAAVPVLIESIGGGNPYQIVAMIFATISAILWMTCVFFAKERITLAQKSNDAPKTSIKSVLNYLKTNKPFLIISGVFFLVFGQMAVSTASGIYLFIYYFEAPELQSAYMLAMIVPSIAGIFICRKLVGRYDKKHLFAFGAIVSSFRFLGVLTGDPMIAIVTGAIGSVFSGFTIGTLWGFVPDTIEYGEKKTGLRIDGLANAILGFFFKFGFALGGLIPGLILEFYNYIPNVKQSEESITGILHLGVTIPLAMMLAAGFLMLIYPLTSKHRLALGLAH